MVADMDRLLDGRIAFRLAIVMAGMMLTGDRRLAATWFACAGVRDDWDRFYDALASFGRNSKSLSMSVLCEVLKTFDPGGEGRWVVAVDDAPTQGYGKFAETAGGTTIRLPVRWAVDGCTDTAGSRWLCWSGIGPGA